MKTSKCMKSIRFWRSSSNSVFYAGSHKGYLPFTFSHCNITMYQFFL